MWHKKTLLYMYTIDIKYKLTKAIKYNKICTFNIKYTISIFFLQKGVLNSLIT